MNFSKLPLELELALQKIVVNVFPDRKYKLFYRIKDDVVYIDFCRIPKNGELLDSEIFEAAMVYVIYKDNINFIVCFVPSCKYLMLCMFYHDVCFELCYYLNNFYWENTDSNAYIISKTKQEFEALAAELYPVLERYFAPILTLK